MIAEGLPRDGDSMRRINAFGLLGAMLGGGLPFKEVPEEFFARHRGKGGVSKVVVQCRCGARPVVELAAYPVSCECQRWFFYTGFLVLALNPPDAPSA